MYSQDVVAANQEVLDAITALAGLGATDFAIFGGLTHEIAISGSNYYLPGFFYLNGNWYYMSDDFDEGFYLAPDVTGIMDYTYEDSVIRPEYNVNYAQTSTSPTGNTPIFSGNMNAYRLDLRSIFSSITTIQTTVALQNVQIPTLPTSYVITFTNDQAIFFAAASSNCAFTFSFVGAVPGTVVRIKWTYSGSASITITAGASQTILKESGDLTAVGTNTNLLTMLYAGKNSIGYDEVSYVLSQTS